MAVVVNKVDKESGAAISEVYYAATEITTSSDWRIDNLLNNAKPKTVEVTANSVRFKCAKGQLVFVVPFKFFKTKKQAAGLSELMKFNQLKHKKQ